MQLMESTPEIPDGNKEDWNEDLKYSGWYQSSLMVAQVQICKQRPIWSQIPKCDFAEGNWNRTAGTDLFHMGTELSACRSDSNRIQEQGQVNITQIISSWLKKKNIKSCHYLLNLPFFYQV